MNRLGDTVEICTAGYISACYRHPQMCRWSWLFVNPMYINVSESTAAAGIHTDSKVLLSQDSRKVCASDTYLGDYRTRKCRQLYNRGVPVGAQGGAPVSDILIVVNKNTGVNRYANMCVCLQQKLC